MLRTSYVLTQECFISRIISQAFVKRPVNDAIEADVFLLVSSFKPPMTVNGLRAVGPTYPIRCGRRWGHRHACGACPDSAPLDCFAFCAKGLARGPPYITRSNERGGPGNSRQPSVDSGSHGGFDCYGFELISKNKAVWRTGGRRASDT